MFLPGPYSTQLSSAIEAAGFTSSVLNNKYRGIQLVNISLENLNSLNTFQHLQPENAEMNPM